MNILPMKKILLLTLFIFNFSFSQEVEKITYKFLNPEIVASDPQGMYTGVPADMYYNGELEKPIQDADDL